MPTVTASRQHPGIRRCREISGVIYETTVAFYTRGEAANSSPSLFISNRSVSEARAAKGEAKAHRSAGATRHIPEDVGRISGFIFEEIRGVQTAGIVLGILCFLLLLATLVYCLKRRWMPRTQIQTEMASEAAGEEHAQ
ncbi:uncharacterized protein LOC118410148 isoform X2 [Branchiostoma floridae]|uniref:Uncharacterized protein LOC118410148 isoform X2 n=1 Tax=Branchiostoma floridae TaxID=7739 RepID=A0A9J7KP50_BRAFL|nr:uncharacterized protein LOC118410148 isoform X2 [Branchiostoma floridae]